MMDVIDARIFLNIISKSRLLLSLQLHSESWCIYGESMVRMALSPESTPQRTRHVSIKGLADEEGYETYVVPDDVGGRFSVLSAVGYLSL